MAEKWWTEASAAPPPFTSSQQSSRGGGSGRRVVQAPTGSQDNIVKRPKRSRNRTDDGTEVPILGEEDAMSQMSQGSG